MSPTVSSLRALGRATCRQSSEAPRTIHESSLRDKHIPDREVPLYYGAADVAVIAHRQFFTSGSAVLALSMGCPVVGPALHHLADLAGPHRLYAFDPAAADGLAEGLAGARASASVVDHAAVRDWAEHYGTWRDAAASTATVLSSGRRT